MNKKKTIIIIIISILIIVSIYSLYNTFAIDSKISNSNDTYTITLTEDNNTITIPSQSSKTVIYQIKNTNKGKVKYAVGYSTGNINVKIYSDSKDKETGLINYGEYKFIKLYLQNTSTTDSTVTINTILGYENGGDLIIPSNTTLVTEIYTPPMILSKRITNLFTKTTTVTNTIISYDYDTTHNLMKDTAGNIRYYGASPNNYVYFNCEEYPSTNCELWRIIGVFDGKIKLIRNSILGTYSWDTSSSSVNNGSGVNEWSQADLMKLLNPDHESESVGGSLYYNSKSGTCYNGQSNATTSCDFTTTGIKNDTTRNMISETTYNTGGWNARDDIYSNVMYEKERGITTVSNPSDGITRTTTWTGKIALPYPSDYGYATDLSKCSQTLKNYNTSTDSYACHTNDWMYPMFGTSSSGWLLTPSSDGESSAFYLYSSGLVYNYGVLYAYGVAPVLYLNANTKVIDGDGTESNPYRLSPANRLPSAYQEVEYIIGNGDEYIETNISCNYNDTVKMVTVGTFSSTNAGAWQGVNAYLQHNFSSDAVSDGTSSLSISNYEVITIIVSYDGSSHTQTTTVGSSGQSISRTWSDSSYGGNVTFLKMGDKSGTYSTTGVVSKLAGGRVYVNNQLKLDLIPAVRKSDSVAGLYDIINNTFYVNSGTGAFDVGANVN